MTSTLQTLNNTAQVDHRDFDLDSFHIHPESNLVYVNHVGLVGKDKLGWTPRRCIFPLPPVPGPLLSSYCLDLYPSLRFPGKYT